MKISRFNIAKQWGTYFVNKSLKIIWGNLFIIPWHWVFNTENNGTLIIKIGPEIRKLCHIYQFWTYYKQQESAWSQTKKCQRLFLCYQFAGTIRFKNHMRVRTTFAEIEEIFIADWQYDELEIALWRWKILHCTPLTYLLL